MKPIIQVEGISKQFRLGKQREPYRTLRDSVASGVRNVFNRFRRANDSSSQNNGEFWALKDVSFDVQPGEVVGIIGRNGSGKSTLLKILSQIYEPTSGRAVLRGRLASLLEVGTGFHPELTGRENIFLNGSILGMTRREIQRKFDEIVAFSEIEKFLDTPVKRYSSGMYVRLAFAVAAHLEPEILIVDEVLAVGDAAFQDKCIGKMQEVGSGGRTVIFVSHNMSAVSTICNSAILLAHGKVKLIGNTLDAINAYKARSNDLVADWQNEKIEEYKPVQFKSVKCKDQNGNTTAHFEASSPIIFEIKYSVHSTTTCQIAFRLNRDDGQTVLTTGDGDTSYTKCSHRSIGTYTYEVKIPGHFLAPGRYHLLLAANQLLGGNYDILESVLNFEISDIGSYKQLDTRLGIVNPIISWEPKH